MKRPMQITPPAIVRIFLPLLAIFLVLSRAPCAHASATVLVLSTGETDTKAFLQSNAEAALREAGLQVATMQDALLSGFDPQFTITCLDRGEVCDALLAKAPAEWILLLRLRESEPGPDADRIVIAQLYSADDGSLLQVEQRVCQRCASNERLGRHLSELVKEIASDELAHKASETYLDISSSPPLAILRIDGVVVGQTGRAYRVRPGEHSIELEMEGYRPATQTLLVKPNEHKALSVSLSKQAGTVESKDRKLRKIFGYGGLGLGTSAMTAGLVWLIVDGDTRKDGNQGGRDRIVDTKNLGIISLVSGSILVGAGVALLLSGQDAAPNEMQISAMPTTEGLSLGLRGQF